MTSTDDEVREPRYHTRGMIQSPDIARRLAAEFVGSLLLAAVVVGSGIAAQRLSPSDVGLQLTQNAAAAAVGLFAIILKLGLVSGAHFNPVITLVDAAFGGMPWRTALAYLPAQVAGCIAGPCWPASPGPQPRATSAPSCLAAWPVRVRLFYPGLGPSDAARAILPAEAVSAHTVRST